MTYTIKNVSPVQSGLVGRMVMVKHKLKNIGVARIIEMNDDYVMVEIELVDQVELVESNLLFSSVRSSGILGSTVTRDDLELYVTLNN